MLSLADNSSLSPHRNQLRGYALESREWVGQGACAQFEDGAVSVGAVRNIVGVMGKYGVLTVGAQGGYSYTLHKRIGASRDVFVCVGEEPCVYLLEPLWFATEVFRISNSPSGQAESHQVVVSIAVR